MDQLTEQDKLKKLAMALAAPSVMNPGAAPMASSAGMVGNQTGGTTIGDGFQAMIQNYQTAKDKQKDAPDPITKFKFQNLLKQIFS